MRYIDFRELSLPYTETKKVIPNAKSCTDKFTHQSRILVQNDALVKGLRIKILYLS